VFGLLIDAFRKAAALGLIARNPMAGIKFSAVVGGTRPERFSAFAITSHHSTVCNGHHGIVTLMWALDFQTCGFRDRLVWHSRRVVSPVRALAESFVGAPHRAGCSPAPASTRSRVVAYRGC
jgi:hypothetical protein